MAKTPEIPTADQIAERADRGEDVSMYFTNKGRMKQPIHRVNVDFAVEMLQELDEVASELNISRDGRRNWASAESSVR